MFKCCIRQESTRDESFDSSTSSDEKCAQEKKEEFESTEVVKQSSDQVQMIDKCTSPIWVKLNNGIAEKSTAYSPQENHRTIDFMPAGQINGLTSNKLDTENQVEHIDELNSVHNEQGDELNSIHNDINNVLESTLNDAKEIDESIDELDTVHDDVGSLLDSTLIDASEIEKVDQLVENNKPNETAKTVPCSGPAYIERTIIDGPDEEGDDSVFESSCTKSNPETNSEKSQAAVAPIPRWLSQEDEDEMEGSSEGLGGMQEPPATPVARDELALRRHRFFSDLLQAVDSAAHKVRFDPLGPTVHSACESSEKEEHFEELVTRLENVTKRLEQVTTQQPTIDTQEIAIQTKSPSPKESSGSAETISPEEPFSPTISSSSTDSFIVSTVVENTNMAVASYQDIMSGPIRDYLALSEKIGGDVLAHSKLVEKAFQIQLQFIQTASSRPAPSNSSEQMSLLEPTSKQIQEIQEFREKHRGSPFFNHLSAISESIPALGWVAVSPTPAPYVKEMNDAGQFYTNRVLKEWKEKDKTHVEWCKAWIQTLTDLQRYIRQYHTTGLVWAKTGSGHIPPPPPPSGIPPPPPSMPLGDSIPSINDDRSALFAQINQGENITKSLKKVTSEMQTHKNPSLRTGPAPFKAPSTTSTSPVKTVLPANAPIDKPPVFTRDGKKWLIEYHKGNKNLLVDNTEMNNVVYMFRCQDSTLVIKGKVNSIVMDSCRKSSVVFDSVVSSIEFVNCQSVQMQVLDKVPTISIDKTDGCQMYLSPNSLGVELITSKSSEMNVMVPQNNGDYMEYPVPEQFKTTIGAKGLTTTAVDSLG